MPEYVATVQWKRNETKFTDNKYSREHIWEFDGGVEIPASSSPHVVPVPYSNAACVDPEEAFYCVSIKLPYALVSLYCSKEEVCC